MTMNILLEDAHEFSFQEAFGRRKKSEKKMKTNPRRIWKIEQNDYREKEKNACQCTKCENYKKVYLEKNTIEKKVFFTPPTQENSYFSFLDS